MKLRVVTAFGGESVEHEISILSAMQAMAAMDPEQYEVIPLYIAKDGQMYSHPSLCELETFQDIEGFLSRHGSVSLLRRDQNYVIVPSHHKLFAKEQEFDIVLPILHGTHGEDGTFQGFLSTLKIPYVGCSVLGGAIGQDKVIMKQVLQDSGIPIPPWFFWTADQELEEAFFHKAQRLGYPLIVKPANLGSSVGIRIVHNDQELHSAMLEAFQYDRKVVLEQVITDLREINCSVLGDEQSVMASELEEVLKQDELLSYRDKYEGGGKAKGMASTSRKVPADVSDEEKQEIRHLAVQTFTALNASGVSRIDFLMDAKNEQVYVNEINTIPGSLSFYLWEASGLQFSQLIDQLISQALKRYRRQQNYICSYDTNILQSYGSGSKFIK